LYDNYVTTNMQLLMLYINTIKVQWPSLWWFLIKSYQLTPGGSQLLRSLARFTYWYLGIKALFKGGPRRLLCEVTVY
jgi:hypothetical protein